MSEPARILVVDDEDSIRGILNETLTDAGYKIIEASNAEEALRMVAEYPFDIVLSDIRMRGLNGLQLLQSIKGLNLGPEVIIMTSQGSLDTAVEAMRHGANDYLLKPFEDLEYVESVIKRALARRALTLEHKDLSKRLKEKEAALAEAEEKSERIMADGRAARELTEKILLARSWSEIPALFKSAAALFGIPRAVLWRLDPTGPSLVAAATLPAEGERPGPIPLPISGGPALTRKLSAWLAGNEIRPALNRLSEKWGGGEWNFRPLSIGPDSVGLVAWAPLPEGVTFNETTVDLLIMVGAHHLLSLIQSSSNGASRPV